MKKLKPNDRIVFIRNYIYAKFYNNNQNETEPRTWSQNETEPRTWSQEDIYNNYYTNTYYTTKYSYIAPKKIEYITIPTDTTGFILQQNFPDNFEIILSDKSTFSMDINDIYKYCKILTPTVKVFGLVNWCKEYYK